MKSIRVSTPRDAAYLEFEELNTRLHATLLESVYLEDWLKDEPATGLELIVSPYCNLKCEYCYIAKHGHELYPNELVKPDIIRANALKVLTWLGENNYHPNIDLFSGEMFAQELGWDICEDVCSFYEQHPQYRRPNTIGIPTNYSFIDTQESTDKIQAIVDRFDAMGIELYLSASIDGLVVDQISRPIRNATIRDQEWYNKCFAFLAKNNFGPHPMVSPSNIHLWKENFLWFVDMMEKYNLQWWKLFLLEVRDNNWTDQNIRDYGDFVDFLMDWMWEKVGHDEEQFFCKFGVKAYGKNKFAEGSGFNMLRASLVNQTDVAACTIQKFVFLRLGDLKIFPCHRTMYPELELGSLTFPEKDVCEINSKNVELAAAVASFSPNKLPLCYKCEMNRLCSTQCYGSQWETVGDMFAPIPTVCRLNAVRVERIARKFKEFGVYPKILSYMPHMAAIQYDRIIGGLS